MDKDLKTLLKAAVWLIAVPTIVVCGGCYAGSNVDYSDGYRDGIVEKVSKKGVFIKTIEGRMLLGGMEFSSDGQGGGNLTARTFDFSVNDAEVMAKLERLPPGKRVRLHYRENLQIWTPKGESSYFITDVEVLGEKK